MPPTATWFFSFQIAGGLEMSFRLNDVQVYATQETLACWAGPFHSVYSNWPALVKSNYVTGRSVTMAVYYFRPPHRLNNVSQQ